MFRSLFAFLFVILLTSCGIESGKSTSGKIDTNGNKGASGTTSTDANGTTSTGAGGTTSTGAGASTSVNTSQDNTPPQIPDSLLHLGGN